MEVKSSEHRSYVGGNSIEDKVAAQFIAFFVMCTIINKNSVFYIV